MSKPSTDTEARQLAQGAIDYFAAWRIESRSDNQILMCDFRDRTRSWLMVCPLTSDGHTKTRLLFGSAVTPVRNPKTEKMALGFGFRALLGFHKIYSRALLCSAKSRLNALSAR